jgi:hypothetical protein
VPLLIAPIANHIKISTHGTFIQSKPIESSFKHKTFLQNVIVHNYEKLFSGCELNRRSGRRCASDAPACGSSRTPSALSVWSIRLLSSVQLCSKWRADRSSIFALSICRRSSAASVAHFSLTHTRSHRSRLTISRPAAELQDALICISRRADEQCVRVVHRLCPSVRAVRVPSEPKTVSLRRQRSLRSKL